MADEDEEVVPGLAEAIEARRIERRLTPGAFAKEAGLSAPGLAPLRKGYRRNYSDKVKLGVCHALAWSSDSIDRLMRGEPPVVTVNLTDQWGFDSFPDPPDPGYTIRRSLGTLEERMENMERWAEQTHNNVKAMREVLERLARAAGLEP